MGVGNWELGIGNAVWGINAPPLLLGEGWGEGVLPKLRLGLPRNSDRGTGILNPHSEIRNPQ